MFIIATLTFVACKKNNNEVPEPVAFFKNGLLVVNEGLFQQNNAHLTWVDFTKEEVNNEIFEQKTNRQLGDTGNDIGRYGSKVYVVVNVSSTIEVLDAQNGSPIKQINMMHNGIPKQPRFITFSNGRAFVPCFDGYVDVIDTASLEVTQRIKVGENPDGIHAANNRLYVINSGGLNFPNVDSTLSVIDLISLTETAKITVGKNPRQVLTDKNGDIWVITQTPSLSWDDFQLVKVNHNTMNIDTTFTWDVNKMALVGDNLLIYTYSNNQSAIHLVNPETGSIIQQNFIPASMFTTFYGAKFDASRNQLYCFDAMNYVNQGYIRVFTPTGTHLRDIKVGLNPSKLLIYE